MTHMTKNVIGSLCVLVAAALQWALSVAFGSIVPTPGAAASQLGLFMIGVWLSAAALAGVSARRLLAPRTAAVVGGIACVALAYQALIDLSAAKGYARARGLMPDGVNADRIETLTSAANWRATLLFIAALFYAFVVVLALAKVRRQDFDTRKA